MMSLQHESTLRHMIGLCLGAGLEFIEEGAQLGSRWNRRR